MKSARYLRGSTGDHASALINLLSDGNSKRVVFFASPLEPDSSFSNSYDGPESNLPLMAALVEYQIPGVEQITIVFDGLFLTAARYPRYREIRSVLDVAVLSNKSWFSKIRAPFTGSNTPEAAATTLGAHCNDLIQLTVTTRARYFSLLSNLTEIELEKL